MDKPSTDAREKLLTVAEVSDLLGVPITTIYAWRYHGEGPQGVQDRSPRPLSMVSG